MHKHEQDWLNPFDAGRISLAETLLDWLNTRPMTGLEQLVIELRGKLDKVTSEGGLSED